MTHGRTIHRVTLSHRASWQRRRNLLRLRTRARRWRPSTVRPRPPGDGCSPETGRHGRRPASPPWVKCGLPQCKLAGSQVGFGCPRNRPICGIEMRDCGRRRRIRSALVGSQAIDIFVYTILAAMRSRMSDTSHGASGRWINPNRHSRGRSRDRLGTRRGVAGNLRRNCPGSCARRPVRG
jgi:hypothetical protein